ncbi:hypothetical protein SBV1_550008 [Verrucomicrobia bacterium]|nr:hypothetical protein SBV1_550008 [Verrucomicrobiota bacterium]
MDIFRQACAQAGPARQRRAAYQPSPERFRGWEKAKKILRPARAPPTPNPRSQSLSKNLIHLTFSTKDRQPSLEPAIREGCHRYMMGILRDLDSPALAIDSIRFGRGVDPWAKAARLTSNHRSAMGAVQRGCGSRFQALE